MKARTSLVTGPMVMNFVVLTNYAYSVPRVCANTFAEKVTPICLSAITSRNNFGMLSCIRPPLQMYHRTKRAIATTMTGQIKLTVVKIQCQSMWCPQHQITPRLSNLFPVRRASGSDLMDLSLLPVARIGSFPTEIRRDSMELLSKSPVESSSSYGGILYCSGVVVVGVREREYDLLR